MPRRKMHGKRHWGALSHDQVWALLMHKHTGDDCAGCSSHATCKARCWVFESDADRRQAWEEHRDQLMEMAHNPGARPAAWWDYEHPGERLPHESQVQALYRLGLLEPGEAAELQRVKPWPPAPATGEDPRQILTSGEQALS